MQHSRTKLFFNKMITFNYLQNWLTAFYSQNEIDCYLSTVTEYLNWPCIELLIQWRKICDHNGSSGFHQVVNRLPWAENFWNNFKFCTIWTPGILFSVFMWDTTSRFPCANNSGPFVILTWSGTWNSQHCLNFLSWRIGSESITDTWLFLC